MVQSAGGMALVRLVRCCRSLLREPRKGINWIESCTGAKRYLLSEDVYKLQTFQKMKLDVARSFDEPKANYIKMFNQKLEKNELILQHELKRLLHLCQSPDDMVTARNAIYRFHEENQNIAGREYKFGPVFMRLCYEFGLETMAVATLTDKNMKGFFNDVTSFNIGIDMLFTKGEYENALEVVRTMSSQGVPFNRHTLILGVGTCYKMRLDELFYFDQNTPESFRFCIDLIEDWQSKGLIISRNAYCFAVALAIRQNDIEKAQSLYSQIMTTDNRLCQNLNVIIHIIAGAMPEAISILSAAMLPKGSIFLKKVEFSQEVLTVLRLRSEDGPYLMEVEHITAQLEQAGQVTPQTLDDLLCQTPKEKRKMLAAMEEMKISLRSQKPLRHTLLSE